MSKRTPWVGLIPFSLLLSIVPAVARAQCTGCANASFAAARSYDLPSSFFYGQYPTAIGDFNGDGYPDVVVYNGASALQVFPGNPTGSFGAPIQTTVPSSVQSIDVGDFNGDGNLDVVAANSYGGLSLYPGDGTGSFQAPTVISLASAAYVAAGNFNGDGIPDIAYVDQSAANVVFLFGLGNELFALGPILPVGPGAGLPAVADLNGDGLSDLIVPNSSGGSVSIVFGSSSGTFAPPADYFIGSAPVSVAVGDFNGDGRPDLAVSSNGGFYSTPVVLLLGAGAGLFTVGGSFNPPVSGAIVAGDFNGDGKTDLIVGGNSTLLLYLGSGAGGFFLSSSSFGAVSNPRMLTADFNRDGIPDLLVSNPGLQNVAVFLSSPGGLTFPKSVAANSYSSLAVGDLNGDGHPGVIVGSYNSAAIYLSDGSGNLTLAGTISYSGSLSNLAAADLNGDGKADLIVTDNNGKVTVFLGFGYGVFGPPTTYSVGPGANFVAIADLNGDGIPDLIVASSGSNSISTLLGVGGGAFGLPRNFSVGSSPVGLAIADFDGDGKPDVVVANSGGSNIALLLGDGTGGFRSLSIFSTTFNPMAVAAADFDGDGHADVAVLGGGNYLGPAALAVFKGNGSGGLSPAGSYLLSGTPTELLAADFNGDGRPDLVVGGGIPGGVSVRMNDSSGHFPVATGYSVGYSNGFGAADFNADGLPDLVTVSSNGGAIAVLINTSCEVRHLGITHDVSACNLPGSAFASQPTVAAFDDGDNVVSCATGSVIASIAPGTGTPGATLGGTKTVPLSAGEAAFTNLSISTAGSSYELLFSNAQAGTTRSRSFQVGGASAITISGPGSVCSADMPSYTADPAYGVYVWTLDGASAGTGRTIVLSGLTAGPHTLQVQGNTGGCTATNSMMINVSASPASPIASSNGPIDIGQTLQLFASTVPGATYSWTGPNGFTSTLQNPSIPSATIAAAGIYTVVAIAGGCASAGSTTSVAVLNPTSFYTVAPCRVVDTRGAIGPYGSPSLAAGGSRNFVMAGQCGIPMTATALSINVTALNRSTGSGFLTAYPGGTVRPVASTVNTNAGTTRANNAIAPLGSAGDLAIYCGQASGWSDVVVDVNGYFQ